MQAGNYVTKVIFALQQDNTRPHGQRRIDPMAITPRARTFFGAVMVSILVIFLITGCAESARCAYQTRYRSGIPS